MLLLSRLLVSVSDAHQTDRPVQRRLPLQSVQAFLQASAQGDLHALSHFLKRNSASNIDSVRDEEGYTALHHASVYGHASTVSLLLSFGADVNAQTSALGLTPIMLACLGEHDNVVSTLVIAGARMDIQDRLRGATALMISAEKGNEALTLRLLLAGAQPWQVDLSGTNASSYASRQGYESLSRLIENYPNEIRQAGNSAVAHCLDTWRCLFLGAGLCIAVCLLFVRVSARRSFGPRKRGKRARDETSRRRAPEKRQPVALALLWQGLKQQLLRPFSICRHGAVWILRFLLTTASAALTKIVWRCQGYSNAWRREQLEASRVPTFERDGDPRARDECVVCLDAGRCYVCVPCGHLCMCEACATKLQASAHDEGELQPRCPTCRAECSNLIRLYS